MQNKKTVLQILTTGQPLYSQFDSRSKTRPRFTEQIHSFVFWQNGEDNQVNISPVYQSDLAEGYLRLETDQERLVLLDEPIVYEKRDDSDLAGMLEDSVV